MIGYSIIAVAIILVIYNKIKGLENAQGLRWTFLIIGIVIFLLSSLTYEFLYGIVQQSMQAPVNWAGVILLTPLVFGSFPIFPHLAFGFFGAFLGIGIAQKDAKPKKVLNSALILWTIFLALGAILFAICIPLGLVETWYFVWGQKFIQLGFYFFLFWLGLLVIDFQPEEKLEKRMKWMKPLTIVGRVTLTVFVLEGVVAVSLQRLFQIFWPTWNSTIGFTILFGLINLAVWALIILGWYFVKFAGSIESIPIESKIGFII